MREDIIVMYEYIKILKRDIELMKYIMCQECKLSEEARIVLEDNLDEYILDDNFQDF